MTIGVARELEIVCKYYTTDDEEKRRLTYASVGIVGGCCGCGLEKIAPFENWSVEIETIYKIPNEISNQIAPV